MVYPIITFGTILETAFFWSLLLHIRLANTNQLIFNYIIINKLINKEIVIYFIYLSMIS